MTTPSDGCIVILRRSGETDRFPDHLWEAHATDAILCLTSWTGDTRWIPWADIDRVELEPA